MIIPMADDAPKSIVDVSDRLIVEQARAALALAAARMGEFEMDTALDQFTVSPRMAKVTGLEVGTFPALDGEFVFNHIHPEDSERVRHLVADRLGEEGWCEVRFRQIRPDTGAVRWLECVAAMVAGREGATPTIVGVVRDITDQVARDEERETLVSELDHRVKNVLATVKSLASQSARRTVSLDAFLKTFSGRLDAMAAAHTLLMATRWRGAAIGDIAAAELGGVAFGRARWEGPEIVLNPRATNALTLALHELASNAVKFGALSTEVGRVDLSWKIRRHGGFDLVWAERLGPPVTAPIHRGFGMTLLEKVTSREMGGETILEFGAAGLRATLRADATALAFKAEPVSVQAPALAVDAGASRGAAAQYDIRDVNILIVEDAVLLALELEAGLTEAGAHVVGSASSLEEAKAMAHMTFDVAVVDADLNGQSAVPFALSLRDRGVPFIFATGYGETAAPEGFSVPVVRKPYNVDQIAAALVEALARP
jgi:PAS domain S-box-containing protein